MDVTMTVVYRSNHCYHYTTALVCVPPPQLTTFTPITSSMRRFWRWRWGRRGTGGRAGWWTRWSNNVANEKVQQQQKEQLAVGLFLALSLAKRSHFFFFSGFASKQNKQGLMYIGFVVFATLNVVERFPCVLKYDARGLTQTTNVRWAILIKYNIYIIN